MYTDRSSKESQDIGMKMWGLLNEQRRGNLKRRWTNNLNLFSASKLIHSKKKCRQNGLGEAKYLESYDNYKNL